MKTKTKNLKYLLYSALLVLIPNHAYAATTNSKNSINNLSQIYINFGAVINDTSKVDNFNIIIVGMIIIILILVGAAMFAPKK